MALYVLDLPIEAANIPSVEGAGKEIAKNTASAPAPEFTRGVFANAVTRRLMWAGRLPSGTGFGTITQMDVKVLVESTVASNECRLTGHLACITPGESISGNKAFGTAVTVDVTMSGTIGLTTEGTITLDSSAELDNAAAGDFFVFMIVRVGGDAADDNTGTMYLNAVQILVTN